jgi:hypothetical protein
VSASRILTQASPLNGTQVPNPASTAANGTSVVPPVIADPFFRPVVAPFTNTTVGPSNETLLQEENSIYTPETLNFVSFDPLFDQLVGPAPVVLTLAQKNYSFAHEGPVCLEGLNALFFTSNRQGNTSTSNQYVETWLMDVQKGNLTQILPTPTVPMANGATLLANNQVLLLSQGANATGGGLVQLDPTTQNATVFLDNWFGLAFNSPNDVVVQYSSPTHRTALTNASVPFLNSVRTFGDILLGQEHHQRSLQMALSLLMGFALVPTMRRSMSQILDFIMDLELGILQNRTLSTHTTLL